MKHPFLCKSTAFLLLDSLGWSPRPSANILWNPCSSAVVILLTNKHINNLDLHILVPSSFFKANSFFKLKFQEHFSTKIWWMFEVMALHLLPCVTEIHPVIKKRTNRASRASPSEVKTSDTSGDPKHEQLFSSSKSRYSLIDAALFYFTPLQSSVSVWLQTLGFSEEGSRSVFSLF